MRKPPNVPWPYRVAALAVAVVLALYTLQIYVFGRKFAGAVANYARMAAQQSAPPSQQEPEEPGVVPVKIIGSDPKKR